MAQTDTSGSQSTSTTPVAAAAPTPAPVNPAIPDLTVEEFCTRLSASDRRVELINAFCFVERTAGHYKDAESNYQSRFQTFVNKPV